MARARMDSKKKGAQESVLELVRVDHEKIAELLDELMSVAQRPESHHDVFPRLRRLLESHASAEEDALYPALRCAPQASELARKVREAHQQIENLIEEMDRLETTDEPWLNSCRQLRELVRAHVKEEQAKVFSELREHFSAEELDALGVLFRGSKSRAKPLVSSAA